jgi:hypothetical protein
MCRISGRAELAPLGKRGGAVEKVEERRPVMRMFSIVTIPF